MRYLIIISALALAGCSNVGLMTNLSGETDTSSKSWGCVTGEFTGTYTASKVVGGRLRVPADQDTSEWTPEQIQGLIDALCRQ